MIKLENVVNNVREWFTQNKKGELTLHSEDKLSPQHQKEWDAKGAIERGDGKVAPTKTVNTMSPSELERSQQRHMVKDNSQYMSAISHTGATREATTGKMHGRVRQEESMAAHYVREVGKDKKWEQTL